MKIKEITKTYGRKVVVKYQPFEFNTTLTVTPDKDNLNAKEAEELSDLIFEVAKAMTERDIVKAWPEIQKVTEGNII